MHRLIVMSIKEFVLCIFVKQLLIEEKHSAKHSDRNILSSGREFIFSCVEVKISLIRSNPFVKEERGYEREDER